MTVVFLFLAAVCVPVSVEATGGMVIQGLPMTDGPAVFWEFRAGVDVAENWNVFTSVLRWELSNFNPTPAYIDFSDGFLSQWQYSIFNKYSESHSGLQLGVRRCLGSFSLELAAGAVDRTARFTLTGGDCPIDLKSEDRRFLGSLGFVVPTGEYGLFNLGVRTEDLNDWFFTAGAGLTLSSDTFAGTGGK